MEEIVQLCHSNIFKNKMFLIFMASIVISIQANRNYTLSDIQPSNCSTKNWINIDLLNNSLPKA